MSEVTIAVRANETWYTQAGMAQALPASTPKSAMLRFALALYNGLDPFDARRYATPKSASKGITGTCDRDVQTTAVISEDLIPSDVPAAYAARVGLLIAMGYSRAEAEDLGRRERTGRPKGSKNKPKPKTGAA